LDEATRILESQGFLLGEVQTTQSSDLLPNTVVSQSVLAGKEFPRERIIQVDLMITDGF